MRTSKSQQDTKLQTWLSSSSILPTSCPWTKSWCVQEKGREASPTLQNPWPELAVAQNSRSRGTRVHHDHPSPSSSAFLQLSNGKLARRTRDQLAQQLGAGRTRGGLCAQLGTVLESGTSLWIPAPSQPTPDRLNFCCCCCH